MFDRCVDEEIISLEMLKALLVDPSMLALPRVEGSYTVDTDAAISKSDVLFCEIILTI